MRVHLQTHGCRLNQAESDSMAHLLEQGGHELVDRVGDAELVLLNSCAITHQADGDARRAVHRARRHNPGVRVAITGCWAEAEPAAAAALPGVELVFGNRAKADVVARLTRPDVPAGALGRPRPVAGLPAAPSRDRTRALLKVQDGCDYRCAFCIVPSVRGASRSIAVEEVVARARALEAAGVPEIVITGIHLGTYGRDLAPRTTLAGLVAKILDGTRRVRLRLSSVDPHEVDDALVGLLAHGGERLCRHLHLPVQSLDDGVLRRMRRAHTAASFEDAARRLLDRVPGIALGTDVIVGFPGESDAAFRNTAARLAALPLAYQHVFPYSVRRGTAAADMTGQVDASVRAARQRELSALSRRQRELFRRARAGEEVPAIIYRGRDPHSGDLRALTDNYLELRVPGDDALRGTGVRVRVGPDGERGRVVA